MLPICRAIRPFDMPRFLWSRCPVGRARFGWLFPNHSPLLIIGCPLDQACARIGVTDPEDEAGLVQYFSQAAISCRRFSNKSPLR